ncbi:N-acetylglucosamine-6-phosphate deacetylase [Periweissella fabaria]|uniref:N-acetylglucosamine-6-phosphate deacetylase n=1 Tax=Periweissella fabaria TaxID=546157 RepID=A0ABM8Z959_9LACO|nr:N-acetylglucosamine-6-phosphate deacetylase [Periweissella fabaria]MCM0598011.1 N-acetylglucosamine-6-phosphate deacetylase [Periweissella fabaria]CAH0417388.1 N-acetylglucosamine-6-phosphate deacetylase [Periweissella fabaria]
MSKVIRHADIYTGSNVIKDGFVRFGSTIEAVGSMDEFKLLVGDEVTDAHGYLLVPGFIDVHTHGAYGFDTMDGNADEIKQMVDLIAKNEGVTTIFPTTMTQSNDAIAKAMAAVNQVAQTNKLIGGVHLEGPFVNPIYKGAQPEQYMQDPSIELLTHWNELSGNRIRLVTYAPERHQARQFEQFALGHNIVPSVGHSDATRAQMQESHATHVTHLYNAQRGLGHREPGVTGHAMMEKNMYAELIADGFHIAPDMLRFAVNIKGSDRIELITDSMRSKGMPEGISELGGQKVIVKDKQARLENGHLAGSVLTYDDAFRNIIDYAQVDIEQAVLMSSVNQAQEFGLTQKGSISVGKDADFNLFDRGLDLKATYSYGELLSK